MVVQWCRKTFCRAFTRFLDAAECLDSFTTLQLVWDEGYSGEFTLTSCCLWNYGEGRWKYRWVSDEAAVRKERSRSTRMPGTPPKSAPRTPPKAGPETPKAGGHATPTAKAPPRLPGRNGHSNLETNLCTFKFRSTLLTFLLTRRGSKLSGAKKWV
eukprot:Skav235949  [mRNA]  locus=scaffold530:46127:46594:+ [translate_table: standard]